MKDHSRTVTVRTPNGLQSVIVPSNTFLSRSLACFRALDHFAARYPRAKLTIESVN